MAMPGSRIGAVSFKVTARVGRGEQVMVCGDAPYLGRGDPERALPLYTTPADYPLWSSKEDMPTPPGNQTGYKYCVFRGGRFSRWESVSKPRVVYASILPQIPRDVLDSDPMEEEKVCQTFEQGRVAERRPSRKDSTEASRQEAEQYTVVASNTSGAEAPGGYSFGTSDASATAEGGGRALTRPSFVAAKAAATAAECLETHAVSLALSPPGHCVEMSPADGGEGADGVQSLHLTAEAASWMQRQQQQRERGGVVNGVGLRRPISLEAQEGEDGGLGLGIGLRLGAEAMISPPPRTTEKAKAASQLWSPRAGGVVVASFYLPVTLTKPAASIAKDDAAGSWTAEWDYEQLVALQTDLRVVRVGTVKCAEPIGEDDKPAVVDALSKLNCVPVFLTEAVMHQCYIRYCKGVLWPVMHNVLEMYDNLPDSLLDYDAITEGWQAYKQVNRAFRSKVVEVFHEGDMIWVHGFHLAILPAFLDRHVKVAQIGLFLHTPFPPSEVFRALPQREELLKGMLGADQVGFHRFVDSKHFMSCCRRLLGLRHVYNPETGLVQIVHGGKPVMITNRHAGVDPDAVRKSLHQEGSQEEAERIRKLHGGRMVIAGVERVERLKGVWLKLMAFENMLEHNPDLVGRVSMHEVGITNEARGEDYRTCQEVVSALVKRLNAKHGPGSVIYEEREIKDITLAKRAALMSVASVFIKNPVHDGLSTTPMEFRVVQEYLAKPKADADDAADADADGSKNQTGASPGVLILSEAVSCSQMLRGSFSVNPWKVEAVAEAMAAAVTASEHHRMAWHEEDVGWCESNTTAAWAQLVLGALGTVVKESRSRYATTGLGLNSRVVETDPSFKRLDTASTRRAYSSSNSRVFFLDYGGTLVKDTHLQDEKGSGYPRRRASQRDKTRPLPPSKAVVEGLEDLCRDPKNVVFVVSGRAKDDLEAAFGHVKGLGLAAEHGSFFRWPQSGRSADDEREDGKMWEALHPGLMDTKWKDVARRFMQDFQIHTHGSYMEEKGTAMLWHYEDADPEFGATQAKQLQDELTDVLCPSGMRTSTTESEALGVTAVGDGAPTVGDDKANINISLSSSTPSSSADSEGYGAIEITHEEGLNSEGGGGGAYLEVRTRGASKGSFVHMVLSRLGWRSETVGDEESAADVPGLQRFCLCVGDDVSDEDMFLAVKAYETMPTGKDTCGGGEGGGGDAVISLVSGGKENRSPRHRQRAGESRLLTVTVGSKPSDAAAWLPGVDAVVSLLRTLARVPSGRETGQMSKLLQQLAILSKNTQYPGESREGHPAPPVRPLSATSHGLPFVAAVHHEGPLPETSTVGDDAAATVPGVSTAIQMMNIGEGVPVVRRHSYSMGGKDKPRISLSLGEFLRGVAQPEPEPPMF